MNGMTTRRIAALFVIIIVVVVGVTIYDRSLTEPESSSYIGEYGGATSVYSDIASESNCATLQDTFDRAAGNNDRATPGTPEHKWTLGYMTAAMDRMAAVGC